MPEGSEVPKPEAGEITPKIAEQASLSTVDDSEEKLVKLTKRIGYAALAVLSGIGTYALAIGAMKAGQHPELVAEVVKQAFTTGGDVLKNFSASRGAMQFAVIPTLGTAVLGTVTAFTGYKAIKG